MLLPELRPSAAQQDEVVVVAFVLSTPLRKSVAKWEAATVQFTRTSRPVVATNLRNGVLRVSGHEPLYSDRKSVWSVLVSRFLVRRGSGYHK